MSLRSLVIAGAGGLGREVAELVRAVNEVTPTWDLKGFLDDSIELRGGEVAGVPVLGSLNRLGDRDPAAVVLCLGSPRRNDLRRAVVERFEIGPDRLATLVHPAAVVPPNTTIGAGTVVLGLTTVTTDVIIGSNVVVMPGAVLTHDDRLHDYVTVAAGVALGGRVSVGDGAYLGAGALVREGLSIGASSVVAMGAVVVADVPPGETWGGTPARRLDHLSGW